MKTVCRYLPLGPSRSKNKPGETIGPHFTTAGPHRLSDGVQDRAGVPLQVMCDRIRVGHWIRIPKRSPMERLLVPGVVGCGTGSLPPVPKAKTSSTATTSNVSPAYRAPQKFQWTGMDLTDLSEIESVTRTNSRITDVLSRGVMESELIVRPRMNKHIKATVLELTTSCAFQCKARCSISSISSGPS